MTQGFFFLVFVVIIAILLFQWLFTAARRQDLGPHRARGTRVAAVVRRIVPADSTPPELAERWHIECQWTDPRSDSVYTFRSDEVDLATARAHLVGAPIAVLIAPGNPDSYFVEVVEP